MRKIAIIFIIVCLIVIVGIVAMTVYENIDVLSVLLTTSSDVRAANIERIENKPTRDRLVGANKELYIKLEQIEKKIDILIEKEAK